MTRRTPRPPITRNQPLAPVARQCSACGGSLWVTYHTARTVTTLDSVCLLALSVVYCHNPRCPRFHQPVRPEEEGAWALP